MIPFEPAEKKFLFHTQPNTEDLRNLPKAYWQGLTEACGGEILSTIQSPRCTAHVLSASSLFIWRHKALLITCGQTKLINSATIALKTLPISAASFLRRQGNRPSDQATSVESDIEWLTSKWGFKPLVFSKLNAKGAVLNAESLSKTHVLLMRNCQGKGHQWGIKGDATSLLKQLEALPLIDRFFLDSHAFSPCGFSCNGIAKDNSGAYFALHQSPQKEANYLSFETDIPNPRDLFHALNALFEPTTMESGEEYYPPSRRSPVFNDLNSQKTLPRLG